MKTNQATGNTFLSRCRAERVLPGDFRKKIYRSIAELQVDLDDSLYRYNHERTN